MISTPTSSATGFRRWLATRAFTLIELLVVIGILAILAGLLLAALSAAKARAQTILCLNNHKQLQLAWHLYAGDYNDSLVPNSPWSGDPGRYPETASWVSGAMTFETMTEFAPWYSDSTNLLMLIPGGYGNLGNYSRAVGIYKCPADKSWINIGGKRHPRVRSVAMNMYMNTLSFGDDGFWYVFRKLSDIRDPSPSQAFVFVDEHEDSIDDGYFGVSMPSVWPDTAWIDLPANRHGGAATFAFADGHAEIRKWHDSRTRLPVKRFWHWYDLHSSQNRDVLWLHARTTSKKPGAPEFP
jgi:prepilin-type N-terminal cleavage/methylation domain-containing protein/prepilin-type processing-associated H-X9-DG protein